ncbi:MAG: hypothetical protein HQK58_04265 [Deltaproteobacteria bacterium]|nr:hypothetical protein [Deltaproteobacteria bacterium]
MYKDFYEMDSEAYRVKPSAMGYFSSKAHEKVWNSILQDTMSGCDLPILVTGEKGTGKSTLRLKLVNFLMEEGKAVVTYVSAPHRMNPVQLPRKAKTKTDPIEGREAGLNASMPLKPTGIADRKLLYVIIDDADDVEIFKACKLPQEGPGAGSAPSRQLILFARHDLVDRIDEWQKSCGDEQMVKRYHLYGLDLAETREYMYFRLFLSGAPGVPTFADDAIEKIYGISRGIPGRIHKICDRCLLLGADRKLSLIGDAIVAESANGLLEFGEAAGGNGAIRHTLSPAITLDVTEAKRAELLRPAFVTAEPRPLVKEAQENRHMENDEGTDTDIGLEPLKRVARNNVGGLRMFIIISMSFIVFVLLGIIFDATVVVKSLF